MTHQLLAQTLNFRQEATTQQVPYAGKTVGTVIGTILTGVLAIAVLAVMVYLILGGFEYITSGGEKGKTESARNKITGAIIGLIVLAASLAILMLVQSFLKITIITFN